MMENDFNSRGLDATWIRSQVARLAARYRTCMHSHGVSYVTSTPPYPIPGASGGVYGEVESSWQWFYALPAVFCYDNCIENSHHGVMRSEQHYVAHYR